MAEFRTKWAAVAVELKASALAVNTQKSYATYRRSYLRFCQLAGYRPVPVTSDQVCQYIAYLSDRLSFSSIKKYLGIIRVLHLEVGMVDPAVFEMYDVKLILLAVKKVLGDKVVRMKPVDPLLLSLMYDKLDFHNCDDCVVWAIILLGFFGLLRISNILGVSGELFSASKFLTRDDITWVPEGIVISLKWAKNNQFKSRIVEVAIPRLDDHCLCPVTALARAFHHTPNVKVSEPAFQRYAKDGKLVPVSYDWFKTRFLGLLDKCGVDRKGFGTHSLRRGGASWALKCGLSADVIRLLGDWSSNAYMCYLEVPLRDRFCYMSSFVDTIQSTVKTGHGTV